jgi:hypothetical protein
MQTDGQVQLIGRHCGTGERLRFSYDDGPIGSGDLVAKLDLATLDDHTGYMLFTKPGDWDVDVGSSDGEFIGNVVINVVAPY